MQVSPQVSPIGDSGAMYKHINKIEGKTGRKNAGVTTKSAL